MNMKKLSVILVTVAALILLLSVHGLQGNPTVDNLSEKRWKDDGPFEAQRSRFALTYSLIEDKSVSFSEDIARFSLPDLGYKNGKYVSIFAPGVSFLSIPGYLLGRLFGASQFGAFLTAAVFAILNVILIRLIANKLGAKDLPATIAALIFLFATPAFSYATTLFQHHISTFLILASIYTLLMTNSFKGHVFIWFLYALSITVDYPNGFMMLPIIVFSIGRLIKRKIVNNNLKVIFHFGKSAALIGIVPVLILFLWFNWSSYGNPLQLAGTVDGVYEIDFKGRPILTRYIVQPDTNENKIESLGGNTFLGFFKTRNLINGLYVHLISPDRGVIIYTPIILFGILGFKYLGKSHSKFSALFISIIGINVILYSMWGDPWGGWAFGSRYLIPSYAVLAILTSFVLNNYRRNVMFLVIFYLVLAYSAGVNTLGAVTSNSNPPKIEAQALSARFNKDEKYTYQRNWEMINQNKSKSFFFNSIASNYLSAWDYFVITSTLVLITITSPIVYLYISEGERRKLFK